MPTREQLAALEEGRVLPRASAHCLSRFVDAGLQIFPDEVVVKGLPWKTTLCVRGTVHLKTPAGETVYENRYVIWGRMSWGLVKEYEVYEDTQKSAALDEYLAVRDRPANPAPEGSATR